MGVDDAGIKSHKEKQQDQEEKMSVIKYFVLPDHYYSSAKGAMLYLNGFPDALIDPEKDEALKAHCDKNLVNYGYQCEETGKFLWNGLCYYCSAKTAQAVEKKFKIDRTVTDKEQQKAEAEKEEKMRSLMKSDEWLENKVLEDSARLFELGLKRNAFVQRIREENTDIAHSRMTRQTQKMFNDGYWDIGAQGKIIAGAKFPADKLSTGPKTIEVKDMYGRVKEKTV